MQNSKFVMKTGGMQQAQLIGTGKLIKNGGTCLDFGLHSF
jgi:hypothetical protein